MADFSKLFPFVLKWEGTNYTDDPRDNGGATKFGVTQEAYSNFLGRPATKAEVKNMTQGIAEEVYKKKYWSLIRGDSLTEGLALIIFDGSVNHGTDRMIKFVQSAVGLPQDGKFGDETLKAVQSEPEYGLIIKLSNLRRARYTNHEDFATYGQGWLNRLSDITNKSLLYANKYVIKKPDELAAEKLPETIVEEEVVQKSFLEEVAPEVSDVLSYETLQKFLQLKNQYNGVIDGNFGKGSKAGRDVVLGKATGTKFLTWDDARRNIALGQLYAKEMKLYDGDIDGLAGPKTKESFKQLNYLLLRGDALPNYLDTVKITPTSTTPVKSPNVWPAQSDVAKYYGAVGSNQTSLILPYKMKLAWDLGTTINKFSCHQKVAKSLETIFNNILSEYGEEKISELRLDVFGGCLNVRPMRGSTKPSMHSWGIAVDIDPERNQLTWNKMKASLAKPEYEAFWKIVEAEGWYSLGRGEDRDWMHFQATKGNK